MDEQTYFKTRNQELDFLATRTKDEFIDEIMRLNQKFIRDWSDITNKKGQLTQEQKDADKVNAK